MDHWDSGLGPGLNRPGMNGLMSSATERRTTSNFQVPSSWVVLSGRSRKSSPRGIPHSGTTTSSAWCSQVVATRFRQTMHQLVGPCSETAESASLVHGDLLVLEVVESG